MFSRLSYTFREMWASLRRNLTLTVAAIITSSVSLLLFGLTLLIQRGFDNQLDAVGGRRRADRLRQERRDARRRSSWSQRALESTPEIIDVAEAALPRRRRARWPRPSGCSPATPTRCSCSREQHPVAVQGRARRRAQHRAADAARRRRSRGLPEVQRGRLPRRSDRRAQQACRASSACVLLRDHRSSCWSSAVLLIWNTIRTAMFARRREIEVMKLVGATNWFIRLPFMLEGLLQGLVGGAARQRRAAGRATRTGRAACASFPSTAGLGAFVVTDGYPSGS